MACLDLRVGARCASRDGFPLFQCADLYARPPLPVERHPHDPRSTADLTVLDVLLERAPAGIEQHLDRLTARGAMDQRGVVGEHVAQNGGA